MEIYKTLEKNYITFEDVHIHVIIEKNNEIWFNANDTAHALDYADYREAIRRHVKKRDTSQLRDIDYEELPHWIHPQTLYLSEPGLYSLILRSKMPAADKFFDWVTHDVLPSIRKYGIYVLKKKYEYEIDDILDDINYLTMRNSQLEKDLKKEKFPKGGVFYVVDYSTDDEDIYRIGISDNMNLRKKIYDTHSLHKRDVVLIQEVKCPPRLEICVKAMLYENRIRDKKDFYICSLGKIKKSVQTCIKSIEAVNKSKNGSKTSFKVFKSSLP